ncbi:MAG: EamA family transporter RarD [Candidatus Nanopelagicales bacterium]|nr:EamA family transporter RarD [Candidatus Nanopelagicales bacterium]
MATRERSSHTTGLILGVTGYLLWGLFPLYFMLLDIVPPIEVVAHRIIWSLVFVVIIVLLGRQWRVFVRAFNRRTVTMLGTAAVFLAINWLVYVYAVSTDQVLQASLGYFVNPLVSVALGVVILKEKLRTAQWAAVGIAIVAVMVLTVAYGELPWIALTLGFSFGIYGLLKKYANLPSIHSLGIETAVLFPIALGILAIAFTRGDNSFAADGPGITALLILLGPVTAVPLLAFGGAAIRIPLSTLGLLQYITPIGQFLLGIFVFHELMSTGRWIGFILVWTALVVFSVDMYRHTRNTSKAHALMRSEQAEIEASGA